MLISCSVKVKQFVSLYIQVSGAGTLGKVEIMSLSIKNIHNINGIWITLRAETLGKSTAEKD
jgi:hypothetical protein